jgi:hypothetical protein
MSAETIIMIVVMMVVVVMVMVMMAAIKICVKLLTSTGHTRNGHIGVIQILVEKTHTQILSRWTAK